MLRYVRQAISTNGGTPSSFRLIDAWRQLVTAYGGTPSKYGKIDIMRQAVIAVGGTPTKWTELGLLRELLVALGVTVTSYDLLALYKQLAGAIKGTPTPTPAPVTTIYGPADTAGVAAMPAGTFNGWAAYMPAPADYNAVGGLAPIALTRQGFDSLGVANSQPDTLYTTKLVRKNAPDQGSLIGNVVALSGYVYSTDSITGCTNNSDLVSPKPIAMWSMPHRLVVGNSLTASVVAVHKDGRRRAGKPVACVEFTATDGTTTLTAKVSSLTCSVDPLTGNAILEYVATFDLTSLTDNAPVTVNAKVYPHFGATGSINDSSANGSNDYDFTARTFRKNTARAAAPPLVYVAAGGNDTTGYVGTDPALAAASPCATPTGAINRARTVLGTGAGALDGLRIRLDAGTWSRSATPTANTVNAAIVVEPIPGVAKASCVLQFGAANNTYGLAHVAHRGLTLQRAGSFYLQNVAGTCLVDDCAFDWNGNTATAIAALATAQSFYLRNVVFNAATSGIGLSSGTAMAIAMMRGCTGGAALSTASIEMICHIGNAMLGGTRSMSKATDDNRFVGFNRFLGIGNATAFLNLSSLTNVTGFANVQNVFEYANAGGTANRVVMPSGDGAVTNIAHYVEWHPTYAGFDAYGRHNALYDESAGTTRRTHRLNSFIGPLGVQLNSKSDIFAAVQAIADAPNRTGNWAFLNGVECEGLFFRYRDAAGAGSDTAGFKQDYPGINSVIGTTNTGAGLDPLFTDYKGTTSGPVAGAGGGTYTLQNGSPAKGLVTDSPLPFDMAGNARGSVAAAGAYA